METSKNICSFKAARELLLERTKTLGVEHVKLDDAYGRILAEDVIARINIPHFEKSPFDGYALVSSDTDLASVSSPVTLKVIREIKAGDPAGDPVLPGNVVKILTGAPIPTGVDCVVKYEDTNFGDDFVIISEKVKKGQNIIAIGEDVCAGLVVASSGFMIDVGTIGMIASQGIETISVFKIPVIGIISTGNEISDIGTKLREGAIYNSNKYILSAAVKKLGMKPKYLGHVGDDVESISEKISNGFKNCDAIILTGGVSAGDYDFVPDAMKSCGISVAFHGIKIKPGMACCYGTKNEKICIGLSGNPASAMTNFYAVASSVLKKLAGYKNHIPETIKVIAANSFEKSAKCDRLLRGKLSLTDGSCKVVFSKDQGNVVIKSMVGNDILVNIPAGHGPVCVGDEFEGFVI